MAEPEQILTTRADDLKGRTDSHKLSPDIHKYVVAHVCAHAYTEINTSSERRKHTTQVMYDVSLPFFDIIFEIIKDSPYTSTGNNKYIIFHFITVPQLI